MVRALVRLQSMGSLSGVTVAGQQAGTGDEQHAATGRAGLYGLTVIWMRATCRVAASDGIDSAWNACG
jgi:hypothetical protein